MPLYARYGLDYSTYPFPDAGEVIAPIGAAGGTAVLAHPGNYLSGMELASLYTTFNELCALGLGGIEAYYPCLLYTSPHEPSKGYSVGGSSSTWV